ncbi:AbrB/MazE/SpoVT family DNA-binding domain-containing protein [Aminobacter aminovorans]|jgi:antitoxin PrlF|uniref:AbrB/MazE/SpoVT family DNA-binding domain-containing protein n=1 Tax=Aminobacter TaxID=31988 RepID=UPI0028673202|nr:AbrB/MazE/SpoVT family DNA-binding domain-containing protein [Aminobacter aminovorans]MDR7221528.1 AbrB family looped-hinge helix DNA binding protein [Aminobacter aminovorans]
MRVTSKGQVTIPRDLRETFGIGANTEVIFGIEGGKITIVPKDEINRLADRDRLDRILAILDRLEGAADLAIGPDELSLLAMQR